MLISDFDYRLPEGLIAQHPLHERRASRLLVYHRAEDRLEHRTFAELPEIIPPEAVLVLNNSRVIPGRLWGIKEEGGARIETLLLDDLGESRWKVIANRAKRLREGIAVVYPEGLSAVVEEVLPQGQFVFRWSLPPDEFAEYCDRLGEMPLPPYIKRPEKQAADRERYQTVYAEAPGSSAAPTAGLHFDEAMLGTLKSRGHAIEEVTLHVGVDTWKPVTVEKIEDHPIHSEFIQVSEETADALNRGRRDGKKILAVGTTSVRTLESAADEDGRIHPYVGRTSLFITPGCEFKAVDCMLTNFHLPKSTLLLLVAAFLGGARWRRVYEEAVKEGYRFYSYGDAMAIL